ncbi:mammalian cell entry protein [Mycolicibacterium sp. CR10]|uniref:mammalian cell entry protein n=1 Tax=Mycolicibacterium sp. CR10 TaxID=2562314 RepID=UPI0010C114ED|nr:mammalian cell entry protein [Mycolicibacterium sp. CR10]
MEDQQPGPGDLTTEDDTTADTAEAAAPQRRWGNFRRRAKPAVAEEVTSEPADEPDPQPEVKAKTPVGKAARVTKKEVSTPDSDAPVSAEEPVGVSDEAVVGDVDEVVETEEAPAEEALAEEAPAEEVTLVPHRPAGSRMLVAAVVAAVLFVGGGAFAAAMAQPYLAERALVETKLDIAQTAADAITTLWTYTPDDMGTLADRASRYLGGDFAEEYRKYIDAIVEPNKQAQVTNTTEVMGAAVESVAPPGIPSEATAIVYTNSVATSPVTKNIPSLRYLSYRLTMQRDGSQWLITRMSTVTSFDLTPQL